VVQTRRDQLHAYRFMTRRAMSALVTGEPDTVEPPMRRLVVTTIGGVLIAVVIVAAFGIIGFLRPGSGDDWKADGTIVVERETGARFLIIGGDLHPVLNYSSAVLASDASSAVETKLVSRDKLSEVDRGETIGIPGLPDSVPDVEDLDAGPVVVCSQGVASGPRVSSEVTVSIGSSTAPSPIGDDEGLFVESAPAEGQAVERYLVWRGERHRITEAVRNAITFDDSPVRVGRAFLSALPEGTPFETLELAALGEKRQVGSRNVRVGEVVTVGGEDAARVMLDDGLATVTPVEAQLLRTLDFPGKPDRERVLSPSDVLQSVSEAGASALEEQTAGLPETLPELADGAARAGGACASFSGVDPPVLGVPEGLSAGTVTDDGAQSAQGVADRVHIEPGTGLVAQSDRAAPVYLVLEPGLKFPAATLGLLGGFGYGGETPVVLPASLLEVIPLGPALDPEAARVQSNGELAAPSGS
jgi:type VII secretion protein EccB